MRQRAEDFFNAFVRGLAVWEEAETQTVSAEEGTTSNYLVLSSKPICKYPVISSLILRLENRSASEIEHEKDSILCSVIPV